MFLVTWTKRKVCTNLCSLYVTVFAKRDHLGANLDFGFWIWSESTLDDLPVALYCASLAGSVSEIRSLKVWNYEYLVFKKTAFKHYFRWIPHSAVLRMMSSQNKDGGTSARNTRTCSFRKCVSKADSTFATRSQTQRTSNSCGWPSPHNRHAEVGSCHKQRFDRL